MEKIEKNYLDMIKNSIGQPSDQLIQNCYSHSSVKNLRLNKYSINYMFLKSNGK